MEPTRRGGTEVPGSLKLRKIQRKELY
jgi:hypothetical protein